MKYRISYSRQAVEDIRDLRKSEPAAFRKLSSLIEELKEHPETGTGKPERLKGNRNGQWSRAITRRHRIIYTIEDKVLYVCVLTAKGHYGDK